MQRFTYDLRKETKPQLGLVVLQTDERIEQDFRQLIPPSADLFVTRIPSAPDVTPETLGQMEADLPASAALFPRSVTFDVVGYGCTSGSAQIGPDRVASLIHGAAQTRSVSEPLSALVAACAALGVRRLAFLSPYVASVSQRLRDQLRRRGVDTPVFGSFEEAVESRVARITQDSLIGAGQALADGVGADALFLSCTNLDTLDVIGDLERRLDLPVLSSNQVLAWHMAGLAGLGPLNGPGRLFAVPANAGGGA